jgi:hypothetical protein
MSKTDWKLLSQQKLTLVTLLSMPNRLIDSEKEPLEGLLNWIDSVQDAAEEDGFPVVWLEG